MLRLLFHMDYGYRGVALRSVFVCLSGIRLSGTYGEVEMWEGVGGWGGIAQNFRKIF